MALISLNICRTYGFLLEKWFSKRRSTFLFLRDTGKLNNSHEANGKNIMMVNKNFREYPTWIWTHNVTHSLFSKLFQCIINLTSPGSIIIVWGPLPLVLLIHLLSDVPIFFFHWNVFSSVLTNSFSFDSKAIIDSSILKIWTWSVDDTCWVKELHCLRDDNGKLHFRNGINHFGNGKYSKSSIREISINSFNFLFIHFCNGNRKNRNGKLDKW